VKIKEPKKIVISRTDSIGDVALTLPLVSILKEKYPEAEIIFLGNTYTKPIVNCLTNVDEVWSWTELQNMEDQQRLEWLKGQNVDVFIHVFPRRELAMLARKANIPHRIGSSHRLFHMLTCNHRVNFTRKNSELHEAQLNTKLLKPFGISRIYTLRELKNCVDFTTIEPLNAEFKTLINPNKKQIILHPKSKGSALEWEVNNFMTLAKSLPSDQFQIFFTGTEDESLFFRDQIPNQDNIIDLSGKMTLNQLISFIYQCNILIAASTGPLHIAGLSGICTIGLFTNRRPLHPGRWQPLGENVHIITEHNQSERNQPLNISVENVQKKLNEVI
jgi:ADP-heptose:LPS heptosyltransferase